MTSRQMVWAVFVCFVFLHNETCGALRRILPFELEIREGEDMQLRLDTAMIDEVSCYVRTPWLESINLKIDENENENDRIKFWSENKECGVQVKNVQKEDQGWWRLVSKNGSNQRLVDVVDVKVLDRVKSIQQQLYILSGLEYNLLLSEKSQFCEVKPPYSEKYSFESVKEDCSINLEVPTTADSGNWTANLKMKGQIEEVGANAKITVLEERIVSGYKKSGKEVLHLYCNVLNYRGILNLCRFTQPEKNQKAFHLNEGLHKGRYRYYGNGLLKGECGLTIENPNIEDFEAWHCLVGEVGKHIFGAYIRIPNLSKKTVDPIFSKSVSPVITSVSNELVLQCSANIPLSYCWLSGPNTTMMIPTDSITSDVGFSKYYSDVRRGLNSGECVVRLPNAEESHEGTWTCHMGPDAPGFELIANIEVQISKTPLAAKNKVVIMEKTEESVSLKCQTVPNRVALQYCRFYSPSGIGMHVSEEITKDKPLVFGTARFWFHGVSTKLGDCGITFQDISLKDIGFWKCAARLEAAKITDEAFDMIEVQLVQQEENENLTAGASAGIATAVIILVVATVFAIYYGKDRIKAYWVPYQAQQRFSMEESPRTSQQGCLLQNFPLSVISDKVSVNSSGSE